MRNEELGIRNSELPARGDDGGRGSVLPALGRARSEVPGILTGGVMIERAHCFGRAVSDDFGECRVEPGKALSPKYRRREQPRGARWQKAALKSEAPFWTSGSGTETA